MQHMLLVINQRVLYICIVMKTNQHQIIVKLDLEAIEALREKAAKKGLSPEAYLFGILKRRACLSLKESSTGKGEAA